MLAEIILFILIGILFGTFTGLIPGIHINLIGAFLISLSATLFLNLNPIYLATFIVAMAITHTFVDFIPSIFMGCPDTDTELSVLPGHDLLKKGQGYQAILLTCYGSLAAIIILLFLAFPSIILIDKTYDLIKQILPYLLIAVSIFLISIEKNKFKSLFVFLLTGILGLCVFNIPQLTQPILPLLTGLFGSSLLITSIKNKTKIPPQKIEKPKVDLFRPLLGSIIASPLCSFLPGLGSGQAAIIGTSIANTDKRGFLVLLGATNTFVMGFSFISLYIISRTRTGAAVAIQEILGQFNIQLLILILITTLISGIIAFFITKTIAKYFSTKMHEINYTKLSKFILIFLSIIILAISKPLGFIIFIISTFTGLYCISLKIRRTNMMGCLLLPTIVFYLV